MKKNILKIAALSFALLGVVFLLWRVDASGSTEVNLELTYWNLTCTYPELVDMGQMQSPNTDTNMTGDNRSGILLCEDLMGGRSGDFLIRSSDLTNGSLDSIPATGIVLTPTGTFNLAISGTCTSIDDTAGPLTLNTDQSWITKTNSSTCTRSYAPDGLVVTVPAYSAVGMYTGTLTITDPMPVI